MDELIEQYDKAGQRVVDLNMRLAYAELDLEKWRSEQAHDRLHTENPLTGKPHSWSSAEAAVKDSDLYREHVRELIQLRAETEVAVNHARRRSYFSA